MRGKLRNTGIWALDGMVGTEVFIVKPELKVASSETKEQRIILKWISENYTVQIWIVSNLLRARYNGRFHRNL